MKIKVYTTADESYHNGDLNDRKVKYFSNEELRDDYFDNVLRKYYISIQLDEYEPNHFGNSDSKWSYFISKGEEKIEIIDEKSW